MSNIIQVSRRDFLQALGATLGVAPVAAALPLSRNGTDREIVQPDLRAAIKEPDKMFGLRVFVLEASLTGNARGYLLRTVVYVEPPELVAHAFAAQAARDSVPLDLFVLRQAGIDQSRLAWFIENAEMQASAAMPTMTLSLTLCTDKAKRPIDVDDYFDDDIIIIHSQHR